MEWKGPQYGTNDLPATHHRIRTHLGICLEKSERLSPFQLNATPSIDKWATRRNHRKENVTQMPPPPIQKKAALLPLPLSEKARSCSCLEHGNAAGAVGDQLGSGGCLAQGDMWLMGQLIKASRKF